MVNTAAQAIPTPVQGPGRRSAERTRERILAAAILRFSQNSYETATLREIAADVGVDVALVHRAFGSKDDLFIAALGAVLDDRLIAAFAEPDPAAAIAALVFEPRLARTVDPVAPIDIVVHSLGCSRATPILRAFVHNHFLLPLQARSGADGPQRAAMLMSCLAGLAIFRDVLCIEALQSDGRDEARLLLERMLRVCLEPAEGSGTGFLPSA